MSYQVKRFVWSSVSETAQSRPSAEEQMNQWLRENSHQVEPVNISISGYSAQHFQTGQPFDIQEYVLLYREK